MKKEKVIRQLMQLQRQLEEIDNYCEDTFTNKDFEYMDLIEIGKMTVHAMDMLSYAIKLINDSNVSDSVSN